MPTWLTRSALVTTLVCSHLSALADTPLDRRAPVAPVSADFFLEACTNVGQTAHGMIAHFDCESYLYGVMETLRHSARTTPRGPGRICLPNSLAPWQVYEILLRAAAPQPPSQSAARYILQVLALHYPCS